MEHLLYELDAGVGILTLNRPEVANALQAAVKDELTDLLRRIKRDPAVRALMITGAGKVFCAGGDIKTMGSGQSCVAGRERMRQTAEWVRELAELEKPVIAAVNGAAAGAGLGLALACDFMVLSDKAKLACCKESGAFCAGCACKNCRMRPPPRG